MGGRGDKGVRDSRRPRPCGADRGVTRAVGGGPLSPAGRVGMPGQSSVGGALGGTPGLHGAPQDPAISRKRKLKRPQSQSDGHRRLSHSRRHGGCWASNPQLPPFFPAPQPAAQLPPLPSSQLWGLPSALWLSRTPSLHQPSSSCSLRFPSTGEAQRGPVTCPRPHRTHHTPS